MITPVFPAPLTWAGAAKATPGVARMVESSRSRAACPPLGGNFAAMTRGPLKPAPNPSARRSKAWRVVSDGGSLPASVKARRIENSGMASTTRTKSALQADDHGWRWIVRLQRYQKPCWEETAPDWSRPGTCNLSMALPAKPSMAGKAIDKLHVPGLLQSG